MQEALNQNNESDMKQYNVQKCLIFGRKRAFEVKKKKEVGCDHDT